MKGLRGPQRGPTMATYGMGWVLHPIVTLAPLKPLGNARIGLLGLERESKNGIYVLKWLI